MNNDAGVAHLFSRVFGTQPEGVWQAPGRVNLIGEHADYNEGFVLPFAIDRSASVAIRRRNDQRVRIASSYPFSEPVETELSRLGEARGWSAYILGAAWALREQGAELDGFDLYLDSTVPSGAGLSSSAALESATALALNELSGAGLSREELVLIGQRAENEIVGAPTGILDQSASLLATEGHAVFLDCRSRAFDPVPLDLADAGLAFLVIDTNVSHSHADGGYRERRASCEAGARALGVPALRDLGPEDLVRAAELLDAETFCRVRHVVTENERVLQTVSLLRAAGPTEIGSLLNESHRSMRDDFEISCPELDLAVATALKAGALGSRMTGGGFGGSAIALTSWDRMDGIGSAILRAFAGAGFARPDLFPVLPGPGAHRVS
ncbi:galactokinase [Acaricomes phytoseiuli]|uniref:galactokinase n=1 Tax=Acaricomes phytoseiuli TaxID=291968 RepID=UPI00037B0BD0|nr:galactokinase [Acaricomes phytoseiuli]MCW1249997.1 galactokinase [Acaricomes phytoseiuli]